MQEQERRTHESRSFSCVQSVSCSLSLTCPEKKEAGFSIARSCPVMVLSRTCLGQYIQGKLDIAGQPV